MNTQERIIEYVKNNPKANGTEIMLAIGKRPESSNVYQTLKRMVQRGRLFKTRNKRYVVTPNMPNVQYELPVSQKYKHTAKVKRPIGRPRKYPQIQNPIQSQSPAKEPSPLERIFLAEIEYVDAGIESLQITKSYLERRVEQIRANGQS